MRVLACVATCSAVRTIVRMHRALAERIGREPQHRLDVLELVQVGQWEQLLPAELGAMCGRHVVRVARLDRKDGACRVGLVGQCDCELCGGCGGCGG
jgi:hypothetical protein